VFAVCLFIACQFYSIYFRLYNHRGPLGFDDSDFYISRIACFKENNIFNRPLLFSVASNFIKNDSAPTVKRLYGYHGIVWSSMPGKLAVFIDLCKDISYTALSQK